MEGNFKSPVISVDVEKGESKSQLLSIETLSQDESESIFLQSKIHGRKFNDENLTLDILRENNLLPRYKISIEGIFLFFSPCYNLRSGRIAVVGYVKNKRNEIVARSFYRSNSLGLWRYLPNYKVIDGHVHWYGKGFGEESITLPIAVQKALAEVSDSSSQILNVDKPELIFAGTARWVDENTTYTGEVESVPIQLGRFSSWDDHKISPQKIKINVDDSPSLDLSKVLAKWSQDSNLYGEISVEVLPSQNGRFKYMFCRDKMDRVWIAGVEDDSEMQSVGLRKHWVDGGDLTTPAYEYATQADKYGNFEKRSGSYVDMFENYLSHVPIIRAYSESRSIELPHFSNKFSLAFEDATDWDSLFEIIDRRGGLQGSKDFFAPDELRDMINGVRNGELDAKHITRTDGLRDVIKKLLEKDELIYDAPRN